MKTIWRRAKTMAENTPAERSRYIDFLRLLSIAVVVLGHWLMALVVVREGEVEVDHLLSAAPRLQYITWFLQVMPIFFIVGGFANAVSWDAALRKGNGYATWLQGRTARLLRPTMVFASVWAVVTGVLIAIGTDLSLLRSATQVVAVPLWFLAVYLGIVTLAPVLLNLDERFGWLVPVALSMAAIAVDVLRFGFGVPGIGWVNFLFVWLTIHQLGVRWQRGFMPKHPSRAVALGVVGFAGLLASTSVGPYAISMVGAPGTGRSNNLPPTVALIALSLFQMGVILALAKPISSWLARPTAWAAVIVGNARIMTLYLWHMTAMVGVIGVGLWLDGTGLGVDPLSEAWWWSRPLWIAVVALPTFGLLVVFGSFEEKRTSSPAAALAAAGGIAAVTWGFAQLALKGFVASGSAAVAILPAFAVIAGSWMLGVRPLAPKPRQLL